MKKYLPYLCLASLATILAACSTNTEQSSSSQGGASSESSSSVSSVESSVESSSETSSESPSKPSSSSPAPVVEKGKINSITSLGQYTNLYVVLSGVAKDDSYDVGDNVTLSFTAGTYFSSEYAPSATYVYVNAVEYHPTLDISGKSMSLTFAMPKGGVDIVYLYSSATEDATNGITWSISNLGSFKVYGLNTEKKYSSPDFYLVGPSNQILNSVSCLLDNETTASIYPYMTESNGVYNVSASASSASGATHATLTLNAITSQEYNITYTGLDSASYDATKSIVPSTAYSGKKVTITVASVASAYISSMTITDASGNLVTTALNGSATFTMPESNISVNVTFADLKRANVVISNDFASYVKDYYFVDATTKEHSLYFQPGAYAFFHVVMTDSSHKVSSIKFDGIAATYISETAVTIDGVSYPDYCATIYTAASSTGNISVDVQEIVTFDATFDISGESYIKDKYFMEYKGYSQVKKDGFSVTPGESLTLYVVLNSSACQVTSLLFDGTADQYASYSTTTEGYYCYVANYDVPADATSLEITIAVGEKVTFAPTVNVTSPDGSVKETYFQDYNTNAKIEDPKFAAGDSFYFYIVLNSSAYYVTSFTINGNAATPIPTSVYSDGVYYTAYYAFSTIASGATSLAVSATVEAKPSATVSVASGSESYISEYYFNSQNKTDFTYVPGSSIYLSIILASEDYEVTSLKVNDVEMVESVTYYTETFGSLSYSVPAGTTNLEITITAGVMTE